MGRLWVTCGYSASPGLAPHPSRMQSSVAVRGWYGCTVFSLYFIYFGPQRPHPPKVKCSTVALEHALWGLIRRADVCRPDVGVCCNLSIYLSIYLLCSAD